MPCAVGRFGVCECPCPQLVRLSLVGGEGLRGGALRSHVCSSWVGLWRGVSVQRLSGAGFLLDSGAGFMVAADLKWARLVGILCRIVHLRRVWAALGSRLKNFTALRLRQP